MIETTLYRIAHSRTGDKGNRLHLMVIAYAPEAYQVLVDQVTVERMTSLFAHRKPAAVHRYELPNIEALNFTLDEVLQGGVNTSLNLDGHGKSLSFLALTLPIVAPQCVLDRCDAARRATTASP